MGKGRRLTLWVDDRTGMIIDEISEKTGTSKSRVVCALLQKSVEELVDENGNLNINGQEQIQKK